MEPKSITQLSPYQFTQLLKLLLELEADKFGIPLSNVSVADNITASDGGIDGKIEWSGAPLNTDFFPHSIICFQCKAKEIFPGECANELIEKKTGLIKTSIDALFERGGLYVLFNSHSINEKGEIARKDAFRSKLHELNKSYAETARIEIFDASKIASWCNKYLAASIAVNNWLGRSSIPGMLTWDEWGNYVENHRFSFETNSQLLGYIEQLRSHFKEASNQVARIIGLPGLGKTRLAFEVFRTPENLATTQQKVVYVDAEYSAAHLPGTISEWIRLGLSGIIVVDNCINSLHIALRKIVTQSNSKISLLSIDYNLDNDPATQIIKLEPHDDGVIQRMLESVYKDKIIDLHRIVAFAQGFPQMAVLLADARLNQDPEMGNLTDDDLLKRLLWGSDSKSHEAYQFLMSCALFAQFGFKDDVKEEAVFISEKISHLPFEKFHRYLMEYKKRGLIKVHGRYAQMIPKPLTIRLASDWWANQPAEQTKEMITAPLPGQLADALCNQVAKLDFLPEIKQLTHQLCGCHGPFGQAEEMLSERGSRLFCTLVETNPVVCVDALERILSPFDKAKLEIIKGKTRRNIIWSLEKICFHRDSFLKGAQLMLSLALAENEKFSNNATGQFLQLFDTFLSGTEAEPKIRLKIIHQSLLSSDINTLKLVVSALERALPKSSSGRWLGAESQGSGKALQDWHPKTWDDVYEYWDTALQILADLAAESSEIGSLAKAAIATNIRGLVRYNRFQILNNVIDLIIRKDGNFWPDALSEIRASLCYDKAKLSQESIDHLESWDIKLQPTNLRNQLRLFVTESLIELDSNKDGNILSSDPHIENLTKLAEKCIQDPKSLIENFDVLLIDHQANSYEFGQILGKMSLNLDEIIISGLDVLKKISENRRNPLILVSLFNQSTKRKENSRDYILNKIENDNSLVIYYPRFLQNNLPTKFELDRYIELIKKNKCLIDSAESFTINNSISHLKSNELSDFLSDIAQFQPKGAWIALEIFSSYRRSHGKVSKLLKDKLMFLISALEITKKSGSDSDLHYWKEEVKFILEKKHKNTAELVSKQILIWLDTVNSSYLSHHLGPVISLLFESYSDTVWPLFSDKIENSKDDYIIKLVNLLKQSHGLDKTIYHILKLREEFLMQWCRENPLFAPKFLAQIIPVIQANGKLHELTLALVNEYGDYPEVLQAIEQNMGTFSWTGGLTHVYNIQKEALQSIENHYNSHVRLWVAGLLTYIKDRINHESIREEEFDIGHL